jgi:hypothetical protein
MLGLNQWKRLSGLAFGIAIAAIAGCASEEPGLDPLVLLLVDTSGSMERSSDCECRTAYCDECLPDCEANPPGKNRWVEVLEALTGTFQDFTCVARDRTSDDFTYDGTYPIPYHEPIGAQQDDGVLDVFANRVRFGLATFDGVASYDDDRQRGLDEFNVVRSQGEYGVWSYPQVDSLQMRPDGTLAGEYAYPGVPHDYVMDTGIRSAEATEGALLAAIEPAAAETTVEAIKASLLRTRPFGGAPIAAALDDLYWYFANDAETAPERLSSERKRHVVLITDGRPDTDFRSVHCDCNEPDSGKDCDDYLSAMESASDMRCPYPTPMKAARHLRCGFGDTCDEGVVSDVHVIGFAMDDDASAKRSARDIAIAGGTDAVFAGNGSELRSALTRMLEDMTGD